MSSQLEGRNAIVYGAAGEIGRAVAAAFAREGATVHLVGRGRVALDAVAAQLTTDGARAEVAVLDALDEAAVEAHVRSVRADWGSVDVSFNLISRGDVQNVPLVDLPLDDLLRATIAGLTSSFVTARASGRVMAEQGRGVILHLNSASGAGAHPGMGSTGPADAATEALMRHLAAELGPYGVRVCGIWTAGVVETLTNERLQKVGGPDMPDAAVIVAGIASMTALRRAPHLAEVAETAAFLASDLASGITGSMTNVTSGLVLR